MSFHNSDVHAVTRRQQGTVLGDLAGANDVRLLDRKNSVHNTQYDLESRPNRLSFIDRGVPVDNLLKHLGIGHKPLSRRDQPLEQKLGFSLVRVRGTDEVHRYVGIDKNQA